MSKWLFVFIALPVCLFASNGKPAVASVAAQDVSGQLLITEVYYDAPGQDELGEWVEIANVGEQLVDLSGHKLTDAPTATSREGAWEFPQGAILAPGEVAVIARSASGYYALFGHYPDYEISESSASITNLMPYARWGTGDFALANDGDEVIVLGEDDEFVDFVNYGDKETLFHPAVASVVTGQSIERAPAYCDTDSAADWMPRTVATPGTITQTGECRLAPDPTADLELLTIGEIQGEADVSPYINQTVSFVARVTGFLSDRNERGIVFYTLFVQELPGNGDADPATSDGIALFLGTGRPRFSAGDDLLITGQVTEFFGYTELDNNGLEMTLLSSGNELPAATEIEPRRMAAEGVQYLETLESMRVSLPEAQVVGPTLAFCSFVVQPAGMQPTRPQSNDPLRLPILHISDSDCDGFPEVKVGDGLAGLAGPLVYHFDVFKLVQQEAGQLRVASAPLELPAPALGLQSDQISIATFNFGDHFDSVRDPNNADAPLPSAAEVANKQAKLAFVIAGQLGCPTLLAIQEVEHDALLQELAAGLIADCGFLYTIAHRESPDARGIDLALMIDPRAAIVQCVAVHQQCAELPVVISDGQSDCTRGEMALFSRPPLQVDLLLGDQPLTVIVNHFKSKREGESVTAPTRLAQALHVADIVAGILADDPKAMVVVLGDFNDGPVSAPLQTLVAGGGLIDGLASVAEELRYSYNFGGVSELLDGILLSPQAHASIVAGEILHLNADYPASWGEDLQSPFRASDHDIPLVILELPVPITPTPEPLPTATTITAPSATPTATGTPVPMPTAPDSSAVTRSPQLLVIAGGALGLILLIAGVLLLKRNH